MWTLLLPSKPNPSTLDPKPNPIQFPIFTMCQNPGHAAFLGSHGSGGAQGADAAGSVVLVVVPLLLLLQLDALQSACHIRLKACGITIGVE